MKRCVLYGPKDFADWKLCLCPFKASAEEPLSYSCIAVKVNAWQCSNQLLDQWAASSLFNKLGWSKEVTRHRCRQMKSGGGVLLVGLLQICIGLVLLGTYEGFKVHVCDVSGACVYHNSTRSVHGVVQVAEAKRTKIVPAAAGKLSQAVFSCCTSTHSLHLGVR